MYIYKPRDEPRVETALQAWHVQEIFVADCDANSREIYLEKLLLCERIMVEFTGTLPLAEAV